MRKKGFHHSKETRQKTSLTLKGHSVSEETRKKLSEAHKGMKKPWVLKKNLDTGRHPSFKGMKHSEETKIKMSELKRGEGTYNYITDRSKLKKSGDTAKDRRSYAYTNWRKEVWLRDNFKCKIANPDCKGRIEAHHILGYTEYPELRYEVNNGITLCHFHHPRKRKDEIRLSPYFKNLVMSNSD